MLAVFCLSRPDARPRADPRSWSMQAREMMSAFDLPERLYRIDCHFWSESPKVALTCELPASVPASHTAIDTSSGHERSSLLSFNLTNSERALLSVHAWSWYTPLACCALHDVAGCVRIRAAAPFVEERAPHDW